MSLGDAELEEKGLALAIAVGQDSNLAVPSQSDCSSLPQPCTPPPGQQLNSKEGKHHAPTPTLESQGREPPTTSLSLDHRDQALNSISLGVTSRSVSEGRLG